MDGYKINVEGFNWCVENDFQVYPVHVGRNRYKIAIRRNGITTHGKDSRWVDGVRIDSVETIGDMEFKDIDACTIYIQKLYDLIREKYKK